MPKYLAGGDAVAEEDTCVGLSNHHTCASCTESDGGVLRKGRKKGGREGVSEGASV